MEHTVSPEHVGPVEWHIARMQDYAVSGRLSRVSECLAGSSEGCGCQKTPGVEGNLALEQGGLHHSCSRSQPTRRCMSAPIKRLQLP